MLWTTTAYAMGSGGAAAGGNETAAYGNIVVMLLIFAVFYFLLIRPNQKRAKEHKAMISALKRGDEIVTIGGLFGRVAETADDYVIVDLGETKVKMSRSAVSAVSNKSAGGKSKKSDDKDGDSKEADGK